MPESRLKKKIQDILSDFVNHLQRLYNDDLVSVTLYGSAVSGEFVEKHSNLNVLVVLKDTDLENLKRASGLINKFKMINPLFLTEDYIASSTDIFPIEFLDMQDNHHLLSGKDILDGINIDTRNLRFQCEQELKAKLINLRQLYLRIYKDSFTLRNLLFKSFISILHILRNVLRLKGKKPPYQKEDILREIALEFQIDTELWKEILAAKNKQIKLSGKRLKQLFVNFVTDLEKIVYAVDRL